MGRSWPSSLSTTCYLELDSIKSKKPVRTMEVNVKELTGVLHLRLVFMIVLVLQSFLAVSFQVC